MHKSRVLLVLAAAYIAGVMLGSKLAVREQVLVGALGVSAVIMAVSAYRRTFGESAGGIRRRKIGFLAGFVLLVAVIGVWRFDQFDATHGMLAQFADRMAGGNGVSVTMRGYIDSDAEAGSFRISVPFRVKEIVVPPRALFVDERVLLSVSSLGDSSYGTFLSVVGTPEIPKSFSDFDYAAYLRKDRIRFVVNAPRVSYISQLQHVTSTDRLRLVVMGRILSWRDSFIISLKKVVPGQASAYLTGILLGVRTELPEAIKEAFNRTSTSHILAISGYNIAVVGQVVMSIFLLVLYRRRAFWATVAVIIIFSVMTGASASVMRAALMGILAIAASSYGRLYDGTAAIVLAAAVMLAVNPLLLGSDIGFQLSFAATIGIMLFYEPVDAWLRRCGVGDTIRSVAATTTAAQASVVPLLAYHFGTISLVSLPANLLILPFVPPAMLAGFVAGITGLFWLFAGKVLGIFAWAISNYQLAVVALFSKLPLASVGVHVALPVVIGIYVVMAVYTLKNKYAR